MAKSDLPTAPGLYWGRPALGGAWTPIRVEQDDAGLHVNQRQLSEFSWLGPFYYGDTRNTLPLWATKDEVLWPPRAAPPVDEPKCLGGYASPVCGLTVWDHYFIAALPAVIARVNNNESEQWASVGATAAMCADLALMERKRREKSDEA